MAPPRSRSLARRSTATTTGCTTSPTCCARSVPSQASDFDDAYTFKFSPREGTPALKLKDAVPDDVAGERLGRLIAVVRRVAARKNAGLVGTTHEVLVEGKAKRGDLLQTRTRGNKVVLVPGPRGWGGAYRTV